MGYNRGTKSMINEDRNIRSNERVQDLSEVAFDIFASSANGRIPSSISSREEASDALRSAYRKSHDGRASESDMLLLKYYEECEQDAKMRQP